MSSGMISEPSYTIGETRNYPKAYRCHLAILREEDGTFSALVLNLPGAGSCGKTEEEAISHAKDAVRVLIDCYLEDGNTIPWESYDSYQIPEGAKLKWILVDAEST